MVKKTIFALACVFVVPLAFAQTSTTITRQTTTTTIEPITVTGTFSAIEEGTAAGYQPAKTLVVRTDDSNNPQRYVLYGTGLIYNKLGQVVRTPIKPGTRVRVYYTEMGETRVVDHVEVEE